MEKDRNISSYDFTAELDIDQKTFLNRFLYLRCSCTMAVRVNAAVVLPRVQRQYKKKMFNFEEKA